MFRYIFGSPLLNLFKQTDQTTDTEKNIIVLGSADISNLSISEIMRLTSDPTIRLKLDSKAMDDAFEQSNIAKLDFLNKKFGLTLRSNGNYHIDVAVEEGNEDMAKFLIQSFGCKPSLYAKQMALAGGHLKLFLWVDAFGIERTHTALHNVHFKTKNKELEWDKCIPDYLRYIDVRAKL